MTRNRTPRDGSVAVVAAIAMVALLAVVALAVDGGSLMDKRRQVQSTADAAALAATDDLYYHWWTGRGLDPSGTAKLAALAAAEANGFKHDPPHCTVEVYVPPLTGPFAGKAGHAEVIISTKQTRYFSRLFGTDDVPFGARAVSRGRRGSIKNGIIVLAPAGKGALSSGGNGGASVSGAPILVNSTDPEAMIANGGGSLAAPEFYVGGVPGWATPGGGTFTGTIVPNSEPVPDPLRFLPAPDPSTLVVRRTNKLQHSAASTLTLQPGVYEGGISISGQATVILEPGIYYMKGGGFTWGGQGTLVGAGVMIYNAPQSVSDKINLSGMGSCSLTPPTSGPYQGMLVFQDRTSTVPMNISGNGQMSLSGTFYCAGANLSVTGNGTNDVIGSQYISDTLTLSGNGRFAVSWSPDTTPGTRDILLVE